MGDIERFLYKPDIFSLLTCKTPSKLAESLNFFYQKLTTILMFVTLAMLCLSPTIQSTLKYKQCQRDEDTNFLKLNILNCIFFVSISHPRK